MRSSLKKSAIGEKGFFEDDRQYPWAQTTVSQACKTHRWKLEELLRDSFLKFVFPALLGERQAVPEVQRIYGEFKGKYRKH